MSVYFVTGATGVVGSALVPHLLLFPESQVVLLTRARSSAHLAERRAKLFEFWGWTDGDELARRTELVQGDVSQPLLGIEPAVYAGLAARCTHIVHSAADVRMTLSLAAARRASLDSAQHVLALARSCQREGALRKIDVVSTIGVAGRMQGLVPERWLHEPRRYHNSYEQAKAETEEYLAAQLRDGMPLTVHRPSMVVGDSQTGRVIRFQIFYALCDLLSGRRTRGLVPAGGAFRLDLVPCDYVAKAIALCTNRPDTVGRVLHLCSGPESALPLDHLGEHVRRVLRAQGIALPRTVRLPTAPLRPFARLVAPLVQRIGGPRILGLLPMLLDYIADAPAFCARETHALLSHAEIDLPATDTYLDRVLTYHVKRRVSRPDASTVGKAAASRSHRSTKGKSYGRTRVRS